MSKHSLAPLPEIKVEPILYTPLPLPTESLKGFLLRACEGNGYERMYLMTRIAGLTDRQTSIAVPDIGRLSALFNFDQNVFLNMGYWPNVVSHDETSFMILGHEIPRLYSTSKVGICPQCIEEKGFIEAFWDIKISLACPEHRRETVYECEECKLIPGNRSALNWNRGEMLRCKLGHDLKNRFGALIEDDLALDLLRLIKAKVDGVPFHRLIGIDHHKFPVQHLENMSLRGFIGIVARLGKPPMPIQMNVMGRDSSFFVNDIDSVGRAAKVLSNWPLRFHEYLAEWRGLSHNSDSNHVGFHRQFDDLRTSLFKSHKSPDDVKWIREGFDNYGRDMWEHGKYLSKAGVSETGRLIGVAQLSKLLGVHPKSIKKRVKSGEIKAIVKRVKGKEKLFFDKENLPSYYEGESLDVREAAAYIGIPVSVLRGSIDTGLMEITEQTRPNAKAFGVKDLGIFKARLMKLVPENHVAMDDSVISLEKMMFMSTGADTLKLDMLKTYLHGGLTALGRSSDSPKGIVFSKNEVLALVNDLKHQYFKGVSIDEAGKRLVTSQSIVVALGEQGYLECTQTPVGRKIMTESIELFEERFISPARFGTEYGYERRVVLNRSESYGIELLRIQTTSLKTNITGFFIAQSEVPRLLEILKVDGTSRRKKALQSVSSN